MILSRRTFVKAAGLGSGSALAAGFSPTPLQLRFVTMDHDLVGPLACGEVAAENIALRLDRKAAISQLASDASFHGGEMSFAQYPIRSAQGERELAGIPVFLYWGFRHRCFFVKRGSALHDLPDLEGRRVGVNAWPDSGNTWSRAALRERGVRIDRIHWLVGPVDNPSDDPFANRPKVPLPHNVEVAPRGKTLTAMLLAGELDALMCPYPPKGFYQRESPFARLISDYRAAERAYAQRVGFYPAHHILAVRRRVFEEHPWTVRSLYDAFERAKQQVHDTRLRLAETTPWTLADLEETTAILGADYQPYGLEPNRAMIRTFSEEVFAQGLVDRPIDPAGVFADFERAMR